MQIAIATTQPFSFAQTLAFACRFKPLETAAIIGPDHMVAAFAHGGRGYAVELRAPGARGGRVDDNLEVTLADDAPIELARRGADLVGATDDLAPFYARAEGDPTMAKVIQKLAGLHQVRFLGLEEIAVYCVMMQRTPVRVAARYKQRFLEKFGLPVMHAGRELRAMPELAALAQLEADDIAEAINHQQKAERIATVVRGVHAIGEEFLRTAPFAEARDALLEIPGVGPFSAHAILLRGLGRTEGLPSLEMFEEPGRKVYGRSWNPDAMTRRYGQHIGTWAYYLKVIASRS
ncbi:MAG: hypothetical protein QM831_16975 [Kofleriaceae bacterium]